MLDALAVFRSLTSSTPGEDALSVRHLSRADSTWIGCDHEGLPVLVAEWPLGGPIPPAVRLRNLAFEPWVECRVKEAVADARTVHASVIRCTAYEPELHEHFLRVMSASLSDMEPPRTVVRLAEAVDSVIAIFQALAQPPQQALQGLWAELLLLANSRDIGTASMSWQQTAKSLVDFRAGRESVEVKSSSSGIRCHRFKLAQLQPTDGSRLYIASFMLTASADGVSVSDLWERIERRLAARPEIRKRISHRIAEAIGDEWRRAHSARFDEQAALRSLRVFEAREIPRVGENAAPEISDIEFSVDLSSCRSISVNATYVPQGLLEALLGDTLMRQADTR